MVRRATADDLDELMRLATVMFDSIDLDSSGADWRDASSELLPDGFDSDSQTAFVVDHPEGGGRLVASAAGSIMQWFPTPFSPRGRVGYVQWVATDPEFRRRGHARAAMEALLDWFRAQQVESVELRAAPDAVALYEGLGFEPPDRPAFRLKL